jgi:hypothetical protein
MGDQAEDRDVQPQLDDILVFDERDLGGYASEVQLYFAAARKLQARELMKLCTDHDVEQSERLQDGPNPTFIKARMIRDLMAHGVALDTGESVSAGVVHNQWKETLAEDGDDVDEPGGDAGNLPFLSAGSSKEQAEAASTVEVLALVQQLRSRLEEHEHRARMQGLEIMRLRASKSEPARESGIGLESVQLREESKGLLWPSTVNAFEQKTLKAKEYQDLIRNNSSDELDLYKRPGMSSDVSKFANKVEFSLKDVWDKHTGKMVRRLEPVVTTLVTAHTHMENAQDLANDMAQSTISWYNAKGVEQHHQLPADLQAKARQLEDDLAAAQGRIVAAVTLTQNETARLCSETQAAIVKKMSVGAAQQLTISKQDEKNRLASMLTPELIATMEKQRQEQKALNHALDAKSKPANQYQGKGAGRGRRPPKGGGKQKQPTRPPVRPPKSPEKGPNSPRPGPKGKGKGEK